MTTTMTRTMIADKLNALAIEGRARSTSHRGFKCDAMFGACSGLKLAWPRLPGVGPDHANISGLDRGRVGLGPGSTRWIGRAVDRYRIVRCRRGAGRRGHDRMAPPPGRSLNVANFGASPAMRRHRMPANLLPLPRRRFEALQGAEARELPCHGISLRKTYRSVKNYSFEPLSRWANISSQRRP